MFDCLCDIADPLLLLWDDWTALAKGDAKAMQTALNVFDECGAGFVVLMQGDGPFKPAIPALQ